MDKETLLQEKYQQVILSYQAKIRETEKDIFANDLWRFNREVLGWPDVNEGCHQELCSFVQSHEGKKKKLILMPRGHLKSSVVTVGYTLQQIAKDPNVRVLIGNATYEMAVNFVGQIKSVLMRNTKFRELYGEMDKGADRWRENQLKIGMEDDLRTIETKEATVTAMGVGGNLTSTHYDLIILDDVVSRDNIGTDEQIRKVTTYYRDVQDLLEPDGELIVIGTRWHDADLYGWLMDPENPESDYVDKFIREAVTNPKIVRDGMKYKLEGDKLLFPEKFSMEKLQELLDGKGPYEFSSQYLNRVITDATQKFRREWMHRYNPDDLKGRTLNKYIMVDPAISEAEGADYTAMVVVGMDEFSKIFVLDIVRERLTPLEIIDRLYLLDEEWKPKTIGLESVAFQKALQYFLAEEGRKRNSHLPITELRVDPTKSKQKRIEGLQPYYARGDIYHPTTGLNIEELERELMRFPRGKHDDIVDALAYFPQLAFPPRVKKERDDRKSKYLY